MALHISDTNPAQPQHDVIAVEVDGAPAPLPKPKKPRKVKKLREKVKGAEQINEGVERLKARRRAGKHAAAQAMVRLQALALLGQIEQAEKLYVDGLMAAVARPQPQEGQPGLDQGLGIRSLHMPQQRSNRVAPKPFV